MSAQATAPAEQTTLARIVELTERKRELDRELRAIKDELEPLHAELLEEFAAEGVSSKRHADSGKLVYLQRQIWARPADPDDRAAACAALEAAGFGAYVAPTFNVHSLSSYFREQAQMAAAEGRPVTDLSELLPEQLRGAIELSEDHKVGVRS